MTTTASVSALKNIATELRIDSIQSTTEAGSGHPTTCMSAAEIVATLFFGEMRYDAEESAEPRQRSLRAVEGSRGADSLRGVGPYGSLSPVRAAQTPAHRFGSRRASDAAAAVCRRRDRFAWSGHLRSRRDCTERETYWVRLSNLRAARRRRDGGRLGVGGRQRRALPQARQPVRDHRRQRARSEPAYPVRPSSRRHCGSLERVRVAHAHGGRSRRRGAAPRVRGGACRQESSDDDSGAHHQRQGRRRRSKARTAGTDGRSRKARRPTRPSPSSRRSWYRTVMRSRQSRFLPPASKSREFHVAPDFSKMPAPAYKPGEQVATREAWGTALAALGRHRLAALSRSTPTSRTRRSAIASRKRSPIASSEFHRRAGDGRRGDGPGRPWRHCLRDDVRVFPHPRRRTSSAWLVCRTRVISSISS